MYGIANALRIAGGLFDLTKYNLKVFTDHEGLMVYKQENGVPKKTTKYLFLSTKILPYLNKAVSYEIIRVRGKLSHKELGNKLQRKCHLACARLARRIIKEKTPKPEGKHSFGVADA